jgi:hypothetical protein
MASFSVYILWILYSFFYSWVVWKYPVNSPLGLNLGAAIHAKSSTLPPNIFTMSAPLTWKIAYSLETIIIFGLYLFFAANAVRLFWLYSKHVIFDLSCVKLIKRAGFLLLIINVSHLMCPAINTYILSHQLQNIPKVLFFGTDQVTLFVISLLLLVTSWIMEESYKIHDEQLHTV